MTYRSSFNHAYGGRASPFASTGAPERSFSDYYEYVDGDDVRRGYSTQYRGGVPEQPIEDDEAPDVIHVRYINTAPFRVEFDPYSISEATVLVKELRQKIAAYLGQDPRRVRLVYKDRDLKKDHRPVKHYGCKQNSEISVVITEFHNDFGTETHSSEDDIRRPSEAGRRYHDEQASIKRRNNSTVRQRSTDDVPVIDSGGLLHPLNGTSRVRQRSRSPGPPINRRPSPGPEHTATPTSTYTASAPMSTTAARSPPRSPTYPAADPNTPMGRVQALQNAFQSKWYPASQRFLNSPPTDATARQKEQRVLSESIMRDIVEKADAIELQGDQSARAERKKMLDAANALIKELDSIK